MTMPAMKTQLNIRESNFRCMKNAATYQNLITISVRRMGITSEPNVSSAGYVATSSAVRTPRMSAILTYVFSSGWSWACSSTAGISAP